jgi:putative transposase
VIFKNGEKKLNCQGLFCAKPVARAVLGARNRRRRILGCIRRQGRRRPPREGEAGEAEHWAVSVARDGDGHREKGKQAKRNTGQYPSPGTATATEATTTGGKGLEVQRELFGGQMTNLAGHLYHATPLGIASGACFHIRIRTKRTENPRSLTNPDLARPLMDGIRHYHEIQRWFAHIAVLMPDHIHAVLSFPSDLEMSKVIGKWKAFHHRMLKIEWQENYFDHRIRSEMEYEMKSTYIRMNPVRAELCADPDQWPWIFEAVK